jgi:putative ABC transport system permease protein
MTWLARLGRRLRILVHRDATERAMDRELRHHIQCETAERIRRGQPPDEAHRAALLDFGGIERIKEDARDARGGRSVEDFVLDLRYAARVLRRNAGFTAAGIVTFALGIGAVTAIFTVVYGVLLRPLPYARPDRLVAIWERHVPGDTDRNVVSADNADAWRARSHSFDAMASIVPTSVTFTDRPIAERAVGAEVSPGYFRLLGVPPALGRDFERSDEQAVILSGALWQRHFGSDAEIVGRGVTISGKTYTVVGVMPGGFEPPRFGWLGQQDLWFPFRTTAENHTWGRFLLVVARLRDGVSIDQARSEMATIAAHREAEDPDNKGWTTSLVPLARQISGDAETALLVVLAAVGLLLLMSVTNVATLTVSLMARRTGELAVRRAIGASDSRLFRQLFTQSALLGSIGAVAGLVLAVPGVRILLAVLPPALPRAASITLDRPVLFVTTTVALLATVAFGSIAAFRGRSSAGLSPMAPRAGGNRTSARTTGTTLVAAEIALAVALSVMALLMARSVGGLRAVDLGFNPGGVLIARVAIPGSRYASPESQRLFFNQLLERVRAIPGVRTAGVISTRPFGGLGPATSVSDPSNPPQPDAPPLVADFRFVDRAALEALRVPVTSGAVPDERDAVSAPPRIVVSASLARALWPGRNAIGRRLATTMYNNLTAEVAAVVGDMHLMDARTPPRPAAYLSATRFPSTQRDLVVRADLAPEALVAALRTAVASLDPSIPLYLVTTMPGLVDASLAADRFTAFLLAAFAAVALAMASVGVFGVFSSEVTRRRKEIGIRMALGASGSGVVALLLGQAIHRAAIGIAAGAAIALVLGRGMGSLLFGIAAADPASFAIVSGIVTGLAVTATLIPAILLLRSAPLSALREG